MKPKKVFSIEDYNRFQLKYGLFTMIALIQYFEEQENFEECSKIVASISRISAETGILFETKLTDTCVKDSIDTWKNVFNIDMTVEKLMATSMLYALDIISQYENA